MSNITEAQKVKTEKYLNKRMNFDIVENDQFVGNKVMTIREHIEYLLNKGNYVKIVQIRDETKERNIQKQIDYLKKQGEPSGNINWPNTKKYYEYCQQLKEGVFKNDYRLYYNNGKENTYYLLTKTEYDYIIRRF